MRRAAFTLLLLSAACGSESAPPEPSVMGGAPSAGPSTDLDGDNPGGGAANQGLGGASPTTCEELDETACQGKDGCEAMRGWNGLENVYASCRFAGESGEYKLCSAVLSCAFPASDGAPCLRFASSCVPSGWTTDPDCTSPGCPAP
jgi:hypothetical protein